MRSCSMASSDTDRLFLMDCTNNIREDTILEKIQRARVKMNALTASKISWHHFAAHSKVNTGRIICLCSISTLITHV